MANSSSTHPQNVLLTTDEWSIWNKYHTGQLQDEYTKASNEYDAFFEAHPWIKTLDRYSANWALARKYIGDELDEEQKKFDHDVQAIRNYNQQIREGKASVLPFVYEPKMFEGHTSGFNIYQLERNTDGTLEEPKHSYAEGRWNVFLNYEIQHTNEYKERERALKKEERLFSKRARAKEKLKMAEIVDAKVMNEHTMQTPTPRQTHFVRLMDALLCPRFDADTPQGKKRPRAHSSPQADTQHKIYDWVIPSPSFASTGDYYHVHRVRDVQQQPEFRNSFASSESTGTTNRPTPCPNDLYVVFHHRRNTPTHPPNKKTTALAIDYAYTRINGTGLSHSFVGAFTDDGRLFLRNPKEHFESLQQLIKWAYEDIGVFLEWAHRQIGQCSFCRRPLSSQTSIERGMGPTCAKRQTRLVQALQRRSAA